MRPRFRRRVSLLSLSLSLTMALLAGCPGNSGTAGDNTTASAPGPASPTPASGGQPGTDPSTGGEPAGQAQPTADSARVVLLPTGQDERTVQVEVARTADEQRRGLMFREHLDADAGMLFVYDRAQPLTFWMRNTYIPLDMIFIKDDLTVLGVVENAEPQTDTSRSVPGLSQYVLEVNAGYAREHGIGAGTRVRFEGIDGLEGTP
jgi:uncharacterized membrane protein (UPF0127 family)